MMTWAVGLLGFGIGFFTALFLGCWMRARTYDDLCEEIGEQYSRLFQNRIDILEMFCTDLSEQLRECQDGS